MATPNSPTDLQIAGPSPEAEPAAEPTSAPAPSQVPGQTDSLESRQLSIEETEALMRGFPPSAEDRASLTHEEEQSQMAQDFFRSIPPESQAAASEEAGAQPPVAEQPAAPAAPGIPARVPPAVAAQAVEQTQQQATPVPTQQPPAPSQEVLSLQAQNRLLTEQLQSIQQQMAAQQVPQQQQQAAVPPQQDPAGPAINVPDSYMNAMASEDPNTRKMALNGLLTGVARMMEQRFEGRLNDVVQAVPQQISQAQESSNHAQQIQNDMYGTYPELANYRAFVGAAAQNLPVNGWSDEVRDMIAERVAPMVPGLMQKVNANRAQRLGYAQVQQPQALPQQPQQGNGQMVPAPTARPPMLARDVQGNLVPVQQPQPYVGGQQTRQGTGGEQVDPQLMDVWQTLGFQ